MSSYQKASGSLFALIALAQLTRSVLGLTVVVGAMVIPVWWSVVACLITGSMAVWAFRGYRTA